MSLWRQIKLVARKELRDGIRDRRSVFSALFVPLLGPILFAVMFTVILNEQSERGTLEVSVVGRENAVALVEYLERQDIEIVDPPADPRAAVADGDEDVIIEIPEDFEANFRAGRPAPISLYLDSSRRDSSKPIRRVRAAIEGYSGKVGTLRLLARGIDPQLARPIAIEDVDTATAQQKAANLLAMIPMFVMMAVFVGGMSLAMDITAGERERRSLEPLLLTPTSRRGLVLGKWLATSVFSVTGLVVTLLGSAVAMSRMPLEEFGMQVDLGAPQLLWIAFALLPIAPMAAGLQMMVASLAKTFREAQTYLSLVTLLPTVPGVFLSLEPLPSEGWVTLVPFLGQQVVLLGVLRGDPVPMVELIFATVITLVLSAIAVAVTTFLFGREKMIFGGG